MGKLWLRLLGIGEEEEADLSRRGFLRLLGGAAVVGVVAPTYVFAPSGGWNNGISELFNGGLTMRQPIMYSRTIIVPTLYDNVFKASPVFTRLAEVRNQIEKQLEEDVLYGV